MVSEEGSQERKEYMDRDNLLSVVEHAVKGSGMNVDLDGKKVQVGVGTEDDPLVEAVLADPRGTLTPIYVLNGTMDISEANEERSEAEPFYPFIVPIFGDEKAIELLGQGIMMGITPGPLDAEGMIEDVRIVFKKADKLVAPPDNLSVRAKYQPLFGKSRVEGNVLINPIIKTTK